MFFKKKPPPKKKSLWETLFATARKEERTRKEMKKEKWRTFEESCEVPEPPVSEEEAYEKKHYR